MADDSSNVVSLVLEYHRASRCWRCNSVKACLIICDELTKKVDQLGARGSKEAREIKQLAWFLKIRCLADDYHTNEALLFNETDAQNEDQVRVLSRAGKQSRHDTSGRATSSGYNNFTANRKTTTSTALSGLDASRPRTGALTGRMPIGSSHSVNRSNTSYRPLTKSLTANQTAFSRTTRPLLKYATNSYLARPFFEYLYNAQTVTNKCPDYRQCLEYITIVKKSVSRLQEDSQSETRGVVSGAELVTIDDHDDQLIHDVFWLVSSGTCYYNLNMNDQAEECFTRAVELNPNHLDSYAWLVKVYLKTNQPSKVLKICNDGLEHCKSDILYNWKSRVQSLFGDLLGANLSLRESLKHFPANLEALANVSHFAFYGDKLEFALRGFERILQLSTNRSTSIDGYNSINGSLSQLYNNLALCNLYCGNYHRVMPFFQKSLLYAPDRETSSDIWYNISFVPLSCGLKNLAIACLRLALKNNSQNEEAINNLGILKYGHLIDDQLHFENKLERWGLVQQKSSLMSDSELINYDNSDEHKTILDKLEIHFATSRDGDSIEDPLQAQPEMLYNMAILKERRGELMASVNFSHLYLSYDRNNYHIKSMLNDIRQLVYHDG